MSTALETLPLLAADRAAFEAAERDALRALLAGELLSARAARRAASSGLGPQEGRVAPPQAPVAALVEGAGPCGATALALEEPSSAPIEECSTGRSTTLEPASEISAADCDSPGRLPEGPPTPKDPIAAKAIARRLHELTPEGQVPEACLKGWLYGVRCADHDDHASAAPEVCGRQNCPASEEQNSDERARDAWDGTAKGGKTRHGLRAFGSVPWGVFVWTLPASMRQFAVGKALLAFRRAAAEMTGAVLARLAGDPGAQTYVASWVHPIGDRDAGKYAPHENCIAPLAALCNEGTRAKRLPVILPREWMGHDGWISAAWRARIAAIFGSSPREVDWFFEFRNTEPKKRHACAYFSRVFPGWGPGLEVDDHKLSLRPRRWGLANSKNSARTARLLELLDVTPYWPWRGCKTCGRTDRGCWSHGPDVEMARVYFHALCSERGITPPTGAGRYLDSSTNRGSVPSSQVPVPGSGTL